MTEEVKNETKKNILVQLILALPLSLLIFLILVFAALVGIELKYADRIFPGVYVYQQDLSGMTLEEANGHLAAALPYTYQGELRLTYEEQVWEAQPIDLGYLIDPKASAQQAYDVGRGTRPGLRVYTFRLLLFLTRELLYLIYKTLQKSLIYPFVKHPWTCKTQRWLLSQGRSA
ncbi:MAG: hypothetical protein XE06_1438 [Anaerolineaceae bacterium 46_22]|nr:MAG: hypothetical protein XE06_1438 [Anaerolineaceae bacterium 46_22]